MPPYSPKRVTRIKTNAASCLPAAFSEKLFFENNKEKLPYFYGSFSACGDFSDGAEGGI